MHVNIIIPYNFKWCLLDKMFLSVSLPYNDGCLRDTPAGSPSILISYSWTLLHGNQTLGLWMCMAMIKKIAARTCKCITVQQHLS